MLGMEIGDNQCQAFVTVAVEELDPFLQELPLAFLFCLGSVSPVGSRLTKCTISAFAH